jgi:hypothetical protein
MESSQERNDTSSASKGVTESVTPKPASAPRAEDGKARSPSEGRVITDEALLKELREAVKGKK